MKVAVIGATIIDMVSYVDKAPNYAQTTTAKDFHIACGAKGANQAVAAKRLGADVLMLSAIGDDLFGQTALENFQKNGIDTRQVIKVPNVSTGVVMIIVEESGQYRSVYYPGANHFLTPKDILNAADDLKNCGLFVIQLEIPLKTAGAAIDFANKNNIPVILNPSPLYKKIPTDNLFPCEFFILNELELRILTDLPTDSAENISIAAKKLLKRGVKNIIVTLGSQGSMWIAEGVEEFVPTLKVELIDSTGAGDAFVGCFVKNYADGKNIRESIQLASKYAALSVTRKGTQDSYLTATEFEKFLSTDNDRLKKIFRF